MVLTISMVMPGRAFFASKGPSTESGSEILVPPQPVPGSATIGMFAKQWHGKVDEVVVVDDHITGVLSEHQAGKLLDIPDTGIKMKGRRSTPGRYFQVAEPGTGWGGTRISDPLSVLGPFDAKKARPGMTMLMVSTTGEHAAFYELDAHLASEVGMLEIGGVVNAWRQEHDGRIGAAFRS